MTANEKLNNLYLRGAQSLEIIRKTAVSPHDSKLLKEWNISDAARMIGRTPQTLRNLEEQKKIPPVRKIKKSSREERVYSLEEINNIRDILGVRQSKPQGKKAITIGIANFKGGVGKSATSLTLSQSLTLRGYKVLLIDSDSQGTSTHLGAGFIPDLHVEEDKTLLNTLIDDKPSIKNCIIKTHWNGLDIIPANLTLYNAEMLIPSQIYQHRQETGQSLDFYSRLSHSLESIKDQYDVILIDTPPSLGFITLNVLFAVEGLIIPLLPSEVDYCSTVQFLNMAQESLKRLPAIHYKFIKLLISRHKPASVQAKTMESAIRSVYGSNVMTNYMIETEAISKASSDMKTLYEVEPHSNDRKTFKRALEHADKLTEELILLLQMVWADTLTEVEVGNFSYSEVG